MESVSGLAWVIGTENAVSAAPTVCPRKEMTSMNNTSIPTTIEDSLGLKTGISINKVRVVYDKDKDWIKITGQLATSSRTYTSFEYEPDLQADIINSQNQICLSSVSRHEGCFAASQKISFFMEMQHVSNYISWDKIEEIRMYLIFRKKG